jgi:starvation-inducible outer membrane lipoprotein
MKTAGSRALIGLLAILLAGCAAQPRQPDWAGVARGVAIVIDKEDGK